MKWMLWAAIVGTLAGCDGGEPAGDEGADSGTSPSPSPSPTDPPARDERGEIVSELPGTQLEGVVRFVVSYRTRRSDGTPAVTGALVYLPDVRKDGLVVVGHPTTGMADSCAPTRDPSTVEELALPWAELGYATIVPDHAGLGNEGVHAYLDNRDAGQVMLDGARALKKLGAGGADILMVGYSQGGGSALSAQALEKSYGTAGRIVGAIGFAPEWPTRENSFGYVDILRAPDKLTILTGVSKVAIVALREYAFFGMTRGEAHAGDGFPDAERASMVSAIESQCLIPLGGVLQANQPKLGELTDPTLRASLLDCIDGRACSEPGKSMHAYLQANILHGDPTGAPILYIQGLADQILPPAEEAACNVAHLERDGVHPQVCTDSSATHATVLGRNLDFAVSWGEAALAGGSRPSCGSSTLPACRP